MKRSVVSVKYYAIEVEAQNELKRLNAVQVHEHGVACEDPCGEIAICRCCTAEDEVSAVDLL